jgi:hypothetical protein
VSVIVLIGPSESLASLRKQLATENTVQTFTDHEVREAVEYIATAKPPIVAIDEEFAVSPRGEALVGRIIEDPSLQGCEIRILPRRKPAEGSTKKKSGVGIPVAVVASPAGAVSPPDGEALAAVLPPLLERKGTRRAERFRMELGVAVTVDGNPAELVDLSAIGAQVVSRIVLKPNQKVRVVLPEETRPLRCGGSVVWASFEMPPGQPPRYRAGLKLQGLDAEAVLGFVERHRAPASDLAD